MTDSNSAIESFLYLVPQHLVNQLSQRVEQVDFERNFFDANFCIRLPSIGDDNSTQVVSFGRERIVRVLEASCSFKCRSLSAPSSKKRKRCEFCQNVKDAQRFLSKELVAFVSRKTSAIDQDCDALSELQMYVSGSNAAMVMHNSRQVVSVSDSGLNPIILRQNSNKCSTKWYGGGMSSPVKSGDVISFVNLDLSKTSHSNGKGFSPLHFVILPRKNVTSSTSWTKFSFTDTKKVSPKISLKQEKSSPETNTFTQILSMPIPTFSTSQTQHSTIDIGNDFAPIIDSHSEELKNNEVFISSLTLDQVKVIRESCNPSSWKHALFGIMLKRNITHGDHANIIIPSILKDAKLNT